MVRPLTKRKSNGELYTRPPEVELAIEQVLGENIEGIIARAAITDWFEDGYIKPECMVHLIRKARRNGDNDLVGKLLPKLWIRCEKRLLYKLRDHSKNVAEEIIEKILFDLTEMFMEDGAGKIPDKLDFFECRFNYAFNGFWIDRTPRRKKREDDNGEAAADAPEKIIEFETIPFSSLQITEDLIENELAHRFEQFRVNPTQEEDIFEVEQVKAIHEAIRSLPSDEQDAILLYYYSEGLINPTELAVASICGVTERTIRNRLSRAYKKLSVMLEGS